MKERPVKYWVVVRDTKIELVTGYWPPVKHIGKFVIDVDGFYYYWPKIYDPGFLGDPFTGWLLIAIGKELGKLNKTWGDKIRRIGHGKN
jgi:hypothetical protein